MTVEHRVEIREEPAFFKFDMSEILPPEEFSKIEVETGVSTSYLVIPENHPKYSALIGRLAVEVVEGMATHHPFPIEDEENKNRYLGGISAQEHLKGRARGQGYHIFIAKIKEGREIITEAFDTSFEVYRQLITIGSQKPSQTE